MGNKYNFDKVINRRHINSYKWNIKDDEYSYSIADMDFDVANEIKEAIKEQADIPTYGYTFVSDEYYEAYIYWWKYRYNTKLKLEWFMFSTSIVASIDSVIKRVSNINDSISLFSPNYNVFYNCIINNHRKILEIPFIYKDYKYSIDWKLTEEMISKSKIFIFCNPHNPIGKQFSEEEIIRLVGLCKKYDVYFISDEIHSDLDYNKHRYVPVLKTSNFDKLVVMLSPGKTFNLAGLHSSVVVIPNESLRNMIKKGLEEDDVGEPTFFSIRPVIAAYTKCEEYVNELNNYISENKAFLNDFFFKNGIKMQIIDSSATYLLWIDISKYSHDSEAFTNLLLKKGKILVCSGKTYHEHYSSFIRLNIATSRENIKKFCDLLLDFLKKENLL